MMSAGYFCFQTVETEDIKNISSALQSWLYTDEPKHYNHLPNTMSVTKKAPIQRCVGATGYLRG